MEGDAACMGPVRPCRAAVCCVQDAACEGLTGEYKTMHAESWLVGHAARAGRRGVVPVCAPEPTTDGRGTTGSPPTAPL